MSDSSTKGQSNNAWGSNSTNQTRQTQGLTLSSTLRSRLKNREVSMRKQVGDAENIVNGGIDRGGLLDQENQWEDDGVV